MSGSEGKEIEGEDKGKEDKEFPDERLDPLRDETRTRRRNLRRETPLVIGRTRGTRVETPKYLALEEFEMEMGRELKLELRQTIFLEPKDKEEKESETEGEIRTSPRIELRKSPVIEEKEHGEITLEKGESSTGSKIDMSGQAKQLCGNYLDGEQGKRAEIFEMLCKDDPKTLGKVISHLDEIRIKNDPHNINNKGKDLDKKQGGLALDCVGEIVGGVVKKNSVPLICSVLNGTKAGDTGTSVCEQLIGMLRGDQKTLTAIGRGCARNIVDAATNTGTVGRSNSGDVSFLKIAGLSGESGKFLLGSVVGKNGVYQWMAQRTPVAPEIRLELLKEQGVEKPEEALKQTKLYALGLVKKLLARLNSAPVPQDLAMVCAELFDCASNKFDEKSARNIAGGHIFIRFISPLLTVPKQVFTENQQKLMKIASKFLQSTVNGVRPGVDQKEQEMIIFAPYFDEVRASILDFVDKVIAAGKLYCAMSDSPEFPKVDPEDATELLYTALKNPALLRVIFSAPTEDDPLGILPVCPSSRLGKAIAKVKRDRSYDLEDLRRDTMRHDEFILEERQTVLKEAERYLEK